MDTRQRLIDHESALIDCWGSSLPPATTALMAEVDSRIDAPTPDPSACDSLPWAAAGAFRIPEQLASAYQNTADERYAVCAASWFRYWLANERFDGQWEASSDPLAICHRIGDTEVCGWLGALPTFCASSAFDATLVDAIVAAAQMQLNHLVGHIHPGRNMRMSQLDCLLTSGLRLAFLDDAASWKDAGLRGLNDMFFRQFHADGSSIESTGWYHYIVQEMALRFYRLSRKRPELGLQVTRDIVVGALDYTLACIEPSGRFNRIGDCTAAVLPFTTLAEFMAYRAATLRALDCEDSEPAPAQYFPDTGQALLRSDWTAGADYLTFDATSRNGFHWHPGRNAIQLHVGGERFLADSGRMSYDPTPQRRYAISTQAHNTLNLNGWNQSSGIATFRARSANGYEVVDSLYSGGYWPFDGPGHGHGVFAEHHRTLLWIQPGLLVIIDHLQNTSAQDGNPNLESNWQFTPGPVDLDPTTQVLHAVRGGAAIRMLFPLKPEGMTATLLEGATEPVAGWVADDDDNPVAAPLLRWSVDDYDPWNADLATVIVTGNATVLPMPVVAAVSEPEHCGHGYVALGWPDGSRDQLWWTRRLETPLEKVDSIQTDASLIHVRTNEAGELRRALVYDGSYLCPWQSAWHAQRGTYALPQSQ